MEITTLVVGLFQTNCYILVKNASILIIDPGASFRRIREAVDSIENAKVRGILLTHGHLDHIGAVDKLVREYGCPVYCCREDEKILTEEKFNSLFDVTATVKSPVRWLEGNELKLGDFTVEIFYTPGHTAGSVMYLIDGKLFSGDTLFRESVGRTDLYSGSSHQLKESLRILSRFDPDTVVYPGHEGSTTVGHELSFNPYL